MWKRLKWGQLKFLVGGLSGECKGHYQRAKHVLGFGFFFFLFVGWLVVWFLWVLRMLATERDSPTRNSLGLSCVNFKKKKWRLAVQSKLDLSDSVPASDSWVLSLETSALVGLVMHFSLFRSASRRNTQNQTLGRKDFLLHRTWCIDKSKYIIFL